MILPSFTPKSVIGRKAKPCTLVANGCVRQTMNIILREEINERIHDFSSRVLCPLLKGTEATFVPIMNGALYFGATMTQQVDEGSRVEIMPVPARRYGMGRSSGSMVIGENLIRPERITGRTVIVLDDILETGQTAAEVVRHINKHNPERVVTVFLTRKMHKVEPAIKPDYWFFEVHSESWVFGYGMDLEEKYRHLRYVCDDRLDLYGKDGHPKY